MTMPHWSPQHIDNGCVAMRLRVTHHVMLGNVVLHRAVHEDQFLTFEEALALVLAEPATYNGTLWLDQRPVAQRRFGAWHLTWCCPEALEKEFKRLKLKLVRELPTTPPAKAVAPANQVRRKR